MPAARKRHGVRMHFNGRSEEQLTLAECRGSRRGRCGSSRLSIIRRGFLGTQKSCNLPRLHAAVHIVGARESASYSSCVVSVKTTSCASCLPTTRFGLCRTHALEFGNGAAGHSGGCLGLRPSSNGCAAYLAGRPAGRQRSPHNTCITLILLQPH